MKIFFSLVLLMCHFVTFSQKIRVIDKTNLSPIENVAIFNEGKNISIVTNSKGEADLSLFRYEKIINFQHTAYVHVFYSYNQIESNGFKILLAEKVYSMDELVVSASKFEEKRKDVVQQIHVIKPHELAFQSQQTSADILQQSGNVMVQKSQAGGGSPIMRGFEANKVLMVIDGVRMNNAIYRGGHLQNSITIDNSMLEKVELVFGPGSVVYGSDALGGVMHFHTKKPITSSDSVMFINANEFIRFSTANEEKTAHVDFNIGTHRLAFLTSFTYSDFGDLRQGGQRNPFYGDWGKRNNYIERVNGLDSVILNSNPNIQIHSGYKQYDFCEKILFKPNNTIDHIINFQYSTSSNIPRYDRLSQLKDGKLRYAQWYYGPQERMFSSYSFSLKKNSFLFDNMRIIAAYQNITESRNNRSYNKTNLDHRIETLSVYTINSDFNKEIGKDEFRYGLEATYNDIVSTAHSEDILTGVTSKLDTRYPDGGAIMYTNAAYLTHTREINPKVIINEGLRISITNLEASFVEKSFFPFPYDNVLQKNKAINGNMGIILMPRNDWRISFLGSSGFRAPNVDDLGKVFESVQGDIIVPNLKLKPEYTYNFEIGFLKEIANKVKIEGVFYYTLYKDAITTQGFRFNGKDSILYDGVMSRVSSMANVNNAFIYGFNGNLLADINEVFSINSSLNYTYGRIKDSKNNVPLDHIPPVFGKTSLNLKFHKWRNEFWVMYNGWKRVDDYNLTPSSEDNFGNATKYGTPAWYTLNLRTAYQFTSNIQIQAALENILDLNYRVYASGISAPGRNLMITLRGRF